MVNLDIEFIVSTVEKYFGMKRLPDYVIQVNEAAKIRNAERKKEEELALEKMLKKQKKQVNNDKYPENEVAVLDKKCNDDNIVNSTVTQSSEELPKEYVTETNTMVKRIRGYKVGSFAYYINSNNELVTCEIVNRKKESDGNYLYDIKLHNIMSPGVVVNLEETNVKPERLKHNYKNRKEKCM